jgi:hypothetical protein
MALLVVIASTIQPPSENVAYNKITTAFRRAVFDASSLLGSAPRVTRAISPTGAPDQVGESITAVGVYAWPASAPWSNVRPMAALERELVQTLATSLRETTMSQWSVTTLPFEPSRNGGIEWWTRGEATRTVTRDRAVSATAAESALGPDAAPPPTPPPPPPPQPNRTLPPQTGVASQGVPSYVVWGGIVAGLAALVYLLRDTDTPENTKPRRLERRGSV